MAEARMTFPFKQPITFTGTCEDLRASGLRTGDLVKPYDGIPQIVWPVSSGGYSNTEGTRTNNIPIVAVIEVGFFWDAQVGVYIAQATFSHSLPNMSMILIGDKLYIVHNEVIEHA